MCYETYKLFTRSARSVYPTKCFFLSQEVHKLTRNWKCRSLTSTTVWAAAPHFNICVMTMHTDCVQVLFIETLNPELKPPTHTSNASKKYKLVRGLWLFLGRICGMTNSSLLWSTEPPRSPPTRELHLLNYPTFWPTWSPQLSHIILQWRAFLLTPRWDSDASLCTFYLRD